MTEEQLFISLITNYNVIVVPDRHNSVHLYITNLKNEPIIAIIRDIHGYTTIQVTYKDFWGYFAQKWNLRYQMTYDEIKI